MLTIQQCDHYLRLLGLSRQEPSRSFLDQLVAAHLTCIPFENISKLYYRKRNGLHGLLPLDNYLDGVERYHFGGTCYTNNYYLNCLLVHLGFNAKLCGADMTNPDVHIVNIVTIDNHEYLVDVGYGAPFITPMPRDAVKDYIIESGPDRYVLKPQDTQGISRMEFYRDGILKHGYRAKPIPRTIDHFTTAVAHSFSDEATFMNALLLVRFYPGRWVSLRNYDLVETEGPVQHITTIKRKDSLPAIIEQYFDIPETIAAEALLELGDLSNPWS